MNLSSATQRCNHSQVSIFTLAFVRLYITYLNSDKRKDHTSRNQCGLFNYPFHVTIKDFAAVKNILYGRDHERERSANAVEPKGG